MTLTPTRSWFESNHETLNSTYLATQTSAASWGPSRLDVVYGVHQNSRLLGHSWYNGAGFQHEARDVQAPAEIYGFAATSRGSGSLDVFYVSDRQIWHLVYDDSAGWHPAYSIGGPPVRPGTELTAVSWGDARLDVFYEGHDHQLIQRFRWNDAGSWSGEVSLPGRIDGRPAAASWGLNRLDVFYRGSDGALHRTMYDEGWVSESLGGAVKGDVAAASWGRDRLDVFYQGQGDSHLYHRYHEVSGWTAHIEVGKFPDPGPGSVVGNVTGLSAVSWAPMRLDLFYCAVPGTLWHHWVGT